MYIGYALDAAVLLLLAAVAYDGLRIGFLQATTRLVALAAVVAATLATGHYVNEYLDLPRVVIGRTPEAMIVIAPYERLAENLQLYLDMGRFRAHVNAMIEERFVPVSAALAVFVLGFLILHRLCNRVLENQNLFKVRFISRVVAIIPALVTGGFWLCVLMAFAPYSPYSMRYAIYLETHVAHFFARAAMEANNQIWQALN